MYLNQSIASEIIKEISPVINTDLNIMDSTGLILASTNPERVNTYHEGAYILIANKMEEFIVEHENQYEGCRKGVNLPICFAREVVGVIGITGEPDKIIGYGRIIQKLTEIIFYENFVASRRNTEDQAKLLFVSDLLHGNFSSSLFYVEQQLTKYQLKAEGPFTTAICKFDFSSQNVADDELLQARMGFIYRYTSDVLATHRTIAVQSGELLLAVSNLESHKLLDAMTDLESQLEAQYAVSLLCIISDTCTDYMDISKVYNEALSAFRYFNKGSGGVLMFSSVNLDFILSQLPELHKKNLTEQIFKECTKEETEEFSSFIRAYMRYDGSLNKLAQHFYIHKNTVQYKIIKINGKTRLDLRKPHDLFLLYMASLYYNAEAESNTRK